MKVEIYRFNKYEEDSNTKAFIDLKFDDYLIVKGFKLIEGREGLFLGNPRVKGKEDKWYDSVRFDTMEQKKEVEKLVIERYNEPENKS